MPIPYFRQLVLLGSLECTFGYPFCATSSQFQRRRLLVTSGQELFNVLLAQARKHPDVQSAIIYDEDFLVDRHRVLEFMHLMERCTELQECPMLLTVFASLRTLGKYSTSELIRCGVGTICIGVESFQTDVLQRESIVKRDGDIEEPFRTLHRHGINRRWERAMRITVHVAPLLTLASAVVAMLAVPILVALYAGARASFWLRPSGDQPKCMRREYAGDRSVSCTLAVPGRSVA